ncbi:MAG TPA: electron transfer flavoprotein subunit alpha/FixB family protein [Myxococcales bacterium]|nr:electron transfer flavoprotein subunit alpha/FixB family protein [Myxococcales bacterium]HIN85784.1 electron transfer flavoprotein subunit alpha/FixB family protein [Myxococcales bacterium]
MSVLVVAEQSNGTVKKASLAAITFARQVSSRTGTGFSIVLLGDGAQNAAASMTAYGAEKIYSVEDSSLTNYLAMPYAAAVATVAQRAESRWVVMTGTTTGKDMLPRVAVRLDAGLASDVIEVAGDGADIKLIRPMWAGNVLAEVQILTEVKCVTVRGSDWEKASPSGGDSALVVVDDAAQAAAAASGTMRFVRFDVSGGDRPDLTEADTVVSGGRGLGSEEKFHLVDPLADVLGAAVGATRAAVDSGYAPNDYQVGQTGKSVAPNLYIAVAISGAIQHLAGMKNSKTIVAINKDPEAPIFQVADYGLVADAFQAVPELVTAIEAIKG